MKNIVAATRFAMVNAHCWFINFIGSLASPKPRIADLSTVHNHRTLAGWRYVYAVIFAGCLLPTANAQTPMSNATSVAAGGFGTCILTNGGGVKCEGYGGTGEIGNNAFLTLKTPVDVIGLTTGVSNIASGSQYACALTTLGGVKCWGGNFNGALGDGSQSSRPAPADVLTLTSGVTAIGAGQRHACALTSSGGVKCWGSNFSGQLGDNSTSTRLAPVDVISGPSLPALAGITAIATGNNHTCALTSSGGVKCWGSNSSGQLGDNSFTDRMTPVDVSTLTSGITAIAAGGNHTCALTSAGGVKCWGYNLYGQLGDNSSVNRSTPVDVLSGPSLPALVGINAIAAGRNHTCALTSAGGVKCWGYNLFGQLGDNSNVDRGTPVDVLSGPSLPALSAATAVTTGGNHTCALISGGQVNCWGNNFYGQLGDNTYSQRLTPVSTLVYADPALYVVTDNFGGDGPGTVTANGINCPGTCTATYAANAVVTLTATPNAGATFIGWGGLCSVLATAPTCTVTMDSSKYVSANFRAALTLSKTGTGAGNISGGPFCPSTDSFCNTSYSRVTTLTLSAAADVGSTFTGWSGDCSGTGACTVTMSTARTVTANFTNPTPTLTVSVTTGAPGIVTGIGGINCPGTCTASYAPNTVVTLTATPSAGAIFSGWSGACTGSARTCAVTMDTAKFATANFYAALTLSKTGTGAGTISGNIFCPSANSSCNTSYSSAQTLTLSAAPDAGSTFTGWGGACSGTGTCTVTMSTARNVTANFTNPSPPLTVSVTTGAPGIVTGTGGINCPGMCTVSYAPNTVVTLTATPNAGAIFNNWSGACSGSATTCTVTMDTAKFVTANFSALLTLNKAGTGNGAISGGVNCGSTSACFSYSNFSGQTLTLSAAPDVGSTFTGWSGDCSGTSTCRVTMSTARNVTANFTNPTPPLTVTVATGAPGSVTGTGGINCPVTCTVFYAPNTVVTLTATPNAGAIFSGWSGACSGSATTCTVTIDAAKLVTANFYAVLTLNKTGTGKGAISGSVNCPSTSACGNYSIFSGQTLTLFASPDVGSTFTGWGGACSGTGTCTVTMTTAKSVTANFTKRSLGAILYLLLDD